MSALTPLQTPVEVKTENESETDAVSIVIKKSYTHHVYLWNFKQSSLDWIVVLRRARTAGVHTSSENKFDTLFKK